MKKLFKGIEKLVNKIKTTIDRITKLQIIKLNDFLIKYPENELSIQHLVTKRIIIKNIYICI
jgi:hypothetical protein